MISGSEENLYYIFAAAATGLSIGAVVIWNWWTRRQAESASPLEKGAFGVDVSDKVKIKRSEIGIVTHNAEASGCDEVVAESSNNAADLQKSASGSESSDEEEACSATTTKENKSVRFKQSDEDVWPIPEEKLRGKLKTASLQQATKKLEQRMTDDQKKEEADIRKKQLEDIFTLLKEQEEKFGQQTTEEFDEQLKLYALG